MDQNTCEEISE